jgi:hypothetical protein
MRILRFLPARWWSLKAWKTWASYIHWRLETYGVYYPDGKLHARPLWSLIRQLPSYGRWLAEFDGRRSQRKNSIIR